MRVILSLFFVVGTLCLVAVDSIANGPNVWTLSKQDSPVGGVAIDRHTGEPIIYLSLPQKNQILKLRIALIDGQPTQVAEVIAGGDERAGNSGDGGPAQAARFNRPYGLATDKYGALWIADTFNHSIRRISPSVLGGEITQLSRIEKIAGGVDNGGRPKSGFAGDGGAADNALLYRPYAVAVAKNGYVGIADTFNNRVRIIRPELNGLVSGTSIINTLIGINSRLNYPYGDGGPAGFASVNGPYGVTFGLQDELYVSDTGHNLIRRVDVDQSGVLTPQSIIQTVVGFNYPLEDVNTYNRSPEKPQDYFGDDGPANKGRLLFPSGIDISEDGRLWIADKYHHRIRLVLPNSKDGTISPESVIYTAAGGSATIGEQGGGFSVDRGISGNLAQFNGPVSVAGSIRRTAVVADTGNKKLSLIDSGFPDFVEMIKNAKAKIATDHGSALNIAKPILDSKAAGAIFGIKNELATKVFTKSNTQLENNTQSSLEIANQQDSARLADLRKLFGQVPTTILEKVPIEIWERIRLDIFTDNPMLIWRGVLAFSELKLIIPQMVPTH